MSTLTCIENYIDSEQNHYACFLLEPLEAGHGITLGNALRRTLLSDLTGFAVVGVRVNNLKHEFATVPGLREDILEIVLNLKEIIFKTSFSEKEKNKKIRLKGFLRAKGPIILTAGMFQLPKDVIQILNPNQYIGTLVDTSDFYLEIDIQNGKGYKLTEDRRRKKIIDKKPSTILIDALYMPVKRVNYKIKIINDTKGNLKESLVLEIWTNGSISPKRSIQEALKILMNIFYPFFVTQEFTTLSTELAKRKSRVFKKKILKKKVK
jgi:DNA-directed RNA polymerase subunit alpha